MGLDAPEAAAALDDVADGSMVRRDREVQRRVPVVVAGVDVRAELVHEQLDRLDGQAVVRRVAERRRPVASSSVDARAQNQERPQHRGDGAPPRGSAAPWTGCGPRR